MYCVYVWKTWKRIFTQGGREVWKIYLNVFCVKFAFISFFHNVCEKLRILRWTCIKNIWIQLLKKKVISLLMQMEWKILNFLVIDDLSVYLFNNSPFFWACFRLLNLWVFDDITAQYKISILCFLPRLVHSLDFIFHFFLLSRMSKLILPTTEFNWELKVPKTTIIECRKLSHLTLSLWFRSFHIIIFKFFTEFSRFFIVMLIVVMMKNAIKFIIQKLFTGIFPSNFPSFEKSFFEGKFGEISKTFHMEKKILNGERSKNFSSWNQFRVWGDRMKPEKLKA